MLNKYVYEDKTLEKAIQKCKEELKLNEEDIIYDDEFQKGNILKSDKVIIKVIKKEELVENIKNYLQEISKYIGIDITSDIIIDSEFIKIKLNSSNPSAIIGKNGKMLNSIQVILKRYLEILTEMSLRVNLDIENYKERKMEQLEKDIKRIVKDVLSTKVDVKLDEMNSYERRIVHNIVSEYDNLTSESEGVAPHRYVVIKYIER